MPDPPDRVSRRARTADRPTAPFVAVLSILLLATAVSSTAASAAEDASAVERRLATAAQYLASEPLEGRGFGSRGLDLAADYIAAQLAEAGLETKLFAGGPFQHFSATASSRLAGSSRLAFERPGREGAPAERVELRANEDYSPLSAAGSIPIDLPMIFTGYGITAAKEGYDDYAGLDVKGKAVVVLRHEPQQDDPASRFNGAKDSVYAPLAAKIGNAAAQGAAAVIFCTDDAAIRQGIDRAKAQWQEALDRVVAAHAEFKKIDSPSVDQIETHRGKVDDLVRQIDRWSQRLRAEADPLLAFDLTGVGPPRPGFAVIHCRRAAMDRVVRAALGTDLASLEREIDRGPTPRSKPLGDWRAVGRIEVEAVKADVKNVVGVLEGRGTLADETIVVGAHYDHLGWGGPGSLAGGEKAIHPGADDNASGVSVMLEVARQLAFREKTGTGTSRETVLPGRAVSRSEPVPVFSPVLSRRRVVFVAFTGEERGLFGSSYYVNHPLFPLDRTIAMVNLDMVGRLRDGKLTVAGAGSAEGFDRLLDQVNRGYGLSLTKQKSGYGPSDHLMFYSRGVPVLHFFTATHADYHRPADVFEKLNLEGMCQIEGFVTDVVTALATAGRRPQYVALPPPTRLAGKRTYLGTIPDFAYQGAGYAISSVLPGGPAERAGLRGGDLVVEIAGRKVVGLDDMDGALRDHGPRGRVSVVVQRDGKELKFDIAIESAK